LPLTRLLFLPDGTLVGAGHTFNPMLFMCTDGVWAATGTLAASKKSTQGASGVSAAMKMFQTQAATGQASATSIETVHQNRVCGLRLFCSSFAGTRAEFSSSALDGKIVFWTTDELSTAMKGLRM